jgi:5-methylcytosine-specific restriction enzyme A
MDRLEDVRKGILRVSTRRRTPGVHSQKRPLGPNGEKLCFNCRAVLPKGRAYNCSKECSREWSHKTSPDLLRRAVFERDHGVCAVCGEDTAALQKEYVSIPFEPASTRLERRWEWLDKHGIPSGRELTDWWDADHITPVVAGGGECSIENIRTLCIPCHKNATAVLAARRATERHKQKVIARDDARGLFAGLWAAVQFRKDKARSLTSPIRPRLQASPYLGLTLSD